MLKEIERELKFKLNREQYEELFSLEGEAVLLVNSYFSPSNGRAINYTLRVRAENGNYTLTRKTGGETGGEVVSLEENVALTEGEAESFIANGISSERLDDFFGTKENEELFVCVGRLETLRKKIRLAGAECDLDKCRYLGVTDYELECEAVDSFVELRKRLEEMGITEPAVSKRRRFQARLKELNKEERL